VTMRFALQNAWECRLERWVGGGPRSRQGSPTVTSNEAGAQNPTKTTPALTTQVDFSGRPRHVPDARPAQTKPGWLWIFSRDPGGTSRAGGGDSYRPAKMSGEVGGGRSMGTRRGAPLTTPPGPTKRAGKTGKGIPAAGRGGRGTTVHRPSAHSRSSSCQGGAFAGGNSALVSESRWADTPRKTTNRAGDGRDRKEFKSSRLAKGAYPAGARRHRPPHCQNCRRGLFHEKKPTGARGPFPRCDDFKVGCTPRNRGVWVCGAVENGGEPGRS